MITDFNAVNNRGPALGQYGIKVQAPNYSDHFHAAGDGRERRSFSARFGSADVVTNGRGGVENHPPHAPNCFGNVPFKIASERGYQFSKGRRDAGEQNFPPTDPCRACRVREGCDKIVQERIQSHGFLKRRVTTFERRFAADSNLDSFVKRMNEAQWHGVTTAARVVSKEVGWFDIPPDRERDNRCQLEADKAKAKLAKRKAKRGSKKAALTTEVRISNKLWNARNERLKILRTIHSTTRNRRIAKRDADGLVMLADVWTAHTAITRSGNKPTAPAIQRLLKNSERFEDRYITRLNARSFDTRISECKTRIQYLEEGNQSVWPLYV